MSKADMRAEIEAVAEPTKYDMSIHSNPDAAAWAAFFKATFPDIDEGLMHGWFANAMMAMHDHMRDELYEAITRAEAAEKARDEWCEVSQKNYQLARDMEKRLIDILYS